MRRLRSERLNDPKAHITEQIRWHAQVITKQALLPHPLFQNVWIAMEEKTAREKQALRIWNTLATTENFAGSRTLLGEPIDLFREALLCYESGYFMASTLLCRSALESALYRMAVAKDIRFRDGPDGVRLMWTYDSLECYLEIGEDYGWIERRASMNFNVSGLYKDAQYVRNMGNFVAHYSPRKDRRFAKRFIEVMKDKDYTSDPIMLWIDEKTAFDVMIKTSLIVQRLISEVFTKDQRNDK